MQLQNELSEAKILPRIKTKPSGIQENVGTVALECEWLPHQKDSLNTGKNGGVSDRGKPR